MRQKAALPAPRLRYNIHSRLASLEKSQSKFVREAVCGQLKIDSSTYYRWLNKAKDDYTDMPSIALRIFAQLLRVPMEELFKDHGC